MLEVGGGPDLAQEAVGAEDGGQLAAQDLDGDVAVVPEVAGEIDRRHAAGTELPLDAVAALERGRELGGCGRGRMGDGAGGGPSYGAGVGGASMGARSRSGEVKRAPEVWGIPITLDSA